MYKETSLSQHKNTDRPSEAESRIETCNVYRRKIFLAILMGLIFMISETAVRNGGNYKNIFKIK